MPPFNIGTIVAFLEERLAYDVYINPDGGIVYQSIFESDFKEIGGRIDFLHACVEDNIYTNDDGEEEIDTGETIKDYQIMVEEEE